MNALRINRTMAFAAVGLCALLLAGCGGSAGGAPVVETVQRGPLLIAVQGQGELQAIHATSLLVPGGQFAQRQLAWMLPDGSVVKKGELVARFSANQSRQDLSDALIDLRRNVLARAGKQAELGSKSGKLGVDMADVDTQLGIARRFANAGPLALSRDKILDSIQDERFLTFKHGVLEWQMQQSGTRGAAELAVIDAQHATYELKADQKRKDLDALELRAPHDGVLILQADWSGVKPSIGSTMWAGNGFAALPDTSAMQVEVSVPEMQAQGIAVGDVVHLHPVGDPSRSVSSRISWVAAAALPKDRESPVKYISVKAPVPAAAARRFGWVPGQLFSADVILIDARDVVSVPNLAVDNGAKGPVVHVDEDGRIVTRAVTLGTRGAARSQVIAGLQAGDAVVLIPAGKGDGT